MRGRADHTGLAISAIRPSATGRSCLPCKVTTINAVEFIGKSLDGA